MWTAISPIVPPRNFTAASLPWESLLFVIPYVVGKNCFPLYYSCLANRETQEEEKQGRKRTRNRSRNLALIVLIGNHDINGWIDGWLVLY